LLATPVRRIWRTLLFRRAVTVSAQTLREWTNKLFGQAPPQECHECHRTPSMLFLGVHPLFEGAP
jgi:hypothetical protein